MTEGFYKGIRGVGTYPNCAPQFFCKSSYLTSTCGLVSIGALLDICLHRDRQYHAADRTSRLINRLFQALFDPGRSVRREPLTNTASLWGLSANSPVRSRHHPRCAGKPLGAVVSVVRFRFAQQVTIVIAQSVPPAGGGMGMMNAP